MLYCPVCYLNLYYVACPFGVENIGSFTFKFAIKKCFNIGVFYAAFCMENMDVFTFESVTYYGAENMVNFTSKCAIKEKSKVPRTR